MLITIKISRISAFLGSDKPRMLFFPLINVQMPTTETLLLSVGIRELTFFQALNMYPMGHLERREQSNGVPAAAGAMCSQRA